MPDNFTAKLLLIVPLLIGILSIYFYVHKTPLSGANQFFSMLVRNKQSKDLINTTFHLSPNVHIVNLSAPTDSNIECVKAKTLLNYISPNVCLHEKRLDWYVSGAFRINNTIWDEIYITRFLKLLLRYPHLDFIDIGANIGAYTMYVAALGRFVLAIECFAPNVDRIRRAVQLNNVANRVIVVQNALYTSSGETLRLSNGYGNIGSQAILVPKTKNDKLLAQTTSSQNDSFAVKTIIFDELLPLLIARGIRGVLLKMDIEGSESFVVQNGSRIFDTLEIPFVQTEWLVVLYPERTKILLDFFIGRDYEPSSYTCAPLNPAEYKKWPADVWWTKKNSSDFC